MRITRRLVTVTLGAGALLLAVAVPASAASTSPGSAALTPIPEPGWAGYYTNNAEVQASTTFVVPKINCSGNPAGNFAGQALGVQFLNNFNGTTGSGYGPISVVQTYCIGRTPYYATEFEFSNAAGTGTGVVASAGVRVRPGDLVETSVQVTASKAVDTLINLSDGRNGFAQMTGAGATNAGPNIGLVGLAGDSSGPTEFGSPAGSSPPAPSTPVVFLGNRIGDQPMTDAAGLGAQEWNNPADTSQVWAAPSGLFADSFAVTVTP